MVAERFAANLTFKGNLKETRYGWLRLTPAYSVHLVSDILADVGKKRISVLDPFCGTGTTALVCAEKNISCDTTDINPFLLWLAHAKTQTYTKAQIDEFIVASQDAIKAMLNDTHKLYWTPQLHQIEKWWQPDSLSYLSRAMHTIKRSQSDISDNAADLLKVAFCKTLIETSNASFNHQSMSFKKSSPPTLPFMDVQPQVVTLWERAVALIAQSAISPIARVPRILYCDARNLSTNVTERSYTHVITSPPYPNRISYIRELRPYMYWLGYLTNGRDAGELDWKAIGGTWGCATSNLNKWQPGNEISNPFSEFDNIVKKVAEKSQVLARYIEKYFYDMHLHCHELYKVVRRGGQIYYVVGNSKFYDQLLPVEQIFAALFEAVGFADVEIATIRKRSSKKELLEFLVTGRKP